MNTVSPGPPYLVIVIPFDTSRYIFMKHVCNGEKTFKFCEDFIFSQEFYFIYVNVLSVPLHDLRLFSYIKLSQSFITNLYKLKENKRNTRIPSLRNSKLTEICEYLTYKFLITYSLKYGVFVK